LKNSLKIDGMNWIQVSQRGEPRISPAAPIWFDIVAFETGINSSLSAPAGRLEAPLVDGLKTALAHYRGDLLLGWYDNWVLTERERLRLLCLRGYRRLMDHYAAIEDLDSALEAGLSSLRVEPLQELIQQRVIELYAASGQRVGAIRQYERLAQLLKSELGITPSRTMRSLIESIKAERPV
jgi:DNA-binding SARP family transcriptional activator